MSPPRVLVLTLVRDAAPYLPAYFEALENLDYPKTLISLGFLEGESLDRSASFLGEKLPLLRGTYARAQMMHHSGGLWIDGARSEPSIQFKRRQILARLRNRLLHAMLRDEDWVLWIDADIVSYAPNTLTRLLSAHRDIVVPNCVREPGGWTFDLNTFQSTASSLREEQRYLSNGIVQPPAGVGRRYLHELRGHDLVPVHGVGGTMLLVRADLHREGLIFPAYSHHGYIETEGLAMMARDLGIECWGMPDVEIVHAMR